MSTEKSVVHVVKIMLRGLVLGRCMQLVCVGGHFTWGAPSEATAFGSPQLHSVTAVLIPHEDLLLVCFSRWAYVELHWGRMYQPHQLPPPWCLKSEL